MKNLPGLPDFGSLLRSCREARGLTVEEVANAGGLPPSTLEALENGAKLPIPKEAVKSIARTLGLDGGERSLFMAAAELSSPVFQVLNALMAAEPAKPPLLASIFVFLIADVRGYTRFTQEFGDTAAARLTGRFAEIIRDVVERRDGRLVELRGDEALTVFGSVRQALQAALELQTCFAEDTRANPDWPLPVGIGVDAGEAAVVEEGYRGAALNRAARLCAQAAAGEILVTAGLMYLAPIVDGLRYAPRGAVAFKGFDTPTDVLAVERAPDEPLQIESP
jgi:class 3 adenylate cyclase